MLFIMAELPSKEVMRKFGTFNKMSKIYKCTDNNVSFTDVDEAMDYFFTKEALDSYKYCHEFKQKLINENSLHWTIDFGVPEDPTIKPWADIWRDTKAQLTTKKKWFKHLQHTIVKHNPPTHLF